MPFQFLCPQGHLLEGDEAHMGMQCQCPQCGTAFIIPTVERPGEPAAAGGGRHAAAADIELEPLAPLDALAEVEEPAPVVRKHAAPSGKPGSFFEKELGAEPVDEVLLHIPCPNGHELETPLDMIGQRAKCPHCGVEFRLKREKSIEHLRQQEILDRQRAKFWFQLAIIAAGFVGVVLLAMIVMAALS